MKKNKYTKEIKGVYIDVYDVLQGFRVTNPAIAHAIKKLLQPGNRGHKDFFQDLKEARDSIERAIELEDDLLINVPHPAGTDEVTTTDKNTQSNREEQNESIH